jgi:hypothetical protein
VTTEELEAAWSQFRRLTEASQKLIQLTNASRIEVRTKMFRVRTTGEEIVINAMFATLHHPKVNGPVYVSGYGLNSFARMMEKMSVRELATFMATIDKATSWCLDRIEGLKRAEYNARLGPSGRQVAARVAMEKMP